MNKNGTYEYDGMNIMSKIEDSIQHRTMENTVKKICLVCGDKALGYNFNAITCESCKAFFRRNALKQKVFKCPFREQCEITVLSRRFCQKCRLRKCFEVGMLSDLIMTSRPGVCVGDQSELKIRKRRRQRDSIFSNPSDQGYQSIPSSAGISSQPLSPTLHQYPVQWQPINPNEYESHPAGTPITPNLPIIHFYHIKLEPDWVYQSCDQNSASLDSNWMEQTEDIGGVLDLGCTISPIKLFRLEELLSANEIMAIPATGPPISYADSTLANHMGEVCIRLCIQFSKRIHAFRNLLPIDQITLLKGAATELMSLRGVMVYQKQVECWRPVGFPHRYLPVSFMPTKDIILRVYSLFPDEWRTSEPIMLCLSSILLFDPTRPNLQDKETIRMHYQFYHELLKDYLKSVYIDGDAVYLRLCQLLGIFRQAVPKIATPARIVLDPHDIQVLSVTFDWPGADENSSMTICTLED